MGITEFNTKYKVLIIAQVDVDVGEGTHGVTRTDDLDWETQEDVDKTVVEVVKQIGFRIKNDIKEIDVEIIERH